MQDDKGANLSAQKTPTPQPDKPGSQADWLAGASLSRQQLAELEEKRKTPAQLAWDYFLIFSPLLCGLAAILEYRLVPDAFTNEHPMTYFYLLVIMIAFYGLKLTWAFWQRSRNKRQAYQELLYQAPRKAVLFLLLLAYDVLTLKTGILTQPFIPPINQIMNIAWIDRDMIILSSLHTLRLLMLGYVIGVALGLITGIFCGYSPRFRYWLDPVIKFLGPIPTSTWIPIIMVITSNLFGGSVFIIALGVWFAVTVATMTGISNVDKSYFDVARTLGAKESQLVFRVAIPSAMPNILQGMTQGMSSACTAIMIAEMMGVKAGLGWYITWAKAWAAYDKMFASLFVISLIFTAVTKLLQAFKNYVLRWQEGGIA